MIKQKTVFVLGAGASCPYGYPTGQELRREICEKFVADSTVYYQAQGTRDIYLEQIKQKATEFTNKFYHSSTKSIDLFLARHGKEYMTIGKFAIIFRILAAEQSSKFREHMRKPEEDWYSYLVDKMADELYGPEDYPLFSDNKVSFVTFNYDRSFEHFLYESLLYSFQGITAEKTKEQISDFRIVHVFGQAAGLDWQDLDTRIGYKQYTHSTSIERMVENLRIIYEEEENPALDEAKNLIGEAKRVFFLGFGYAKENLDILGIPDVLGEKSNIYGTTLGLTDREVQDVGLHFSITIGDRLHLENLDCLALLREYL